MLADFTEASGAPLDECSALPEKDGDAVYKVRSSQHRKLLGKVLGALDMSLPNKQQHAAATHVVRAAFDETYFKMLELTYPDAAFGFVEGAYALEPIR